MHSISYSALLRWASQAVHRGALIVAGDAYAAMERADNLHARAVAARKAEWHLAHHLDELVLASAHETAEATAEELTALENDILASVNAPIDTGAKIQRETRDQAWLRRAHSALDAFVKFLDHEMYVSNAAHTVGMEQG